MKIWGILLYWIGVQSAMSNYVYREYYEDAFIDGYKYIWDQMEFMTDYDYKSLCYFRLLTSFYFSNAADLTERRALQYSYLSNYFKATNNSNNINVYKKVLPIESNIPSIISQICYLYDQVPERNFSDKEKLNTDISQLYDDCRFNLIMREAYQIAKLTGLVAIMPQWIDDKLNFTIFTPDQFRVDKQVNDSTDPDTFYYPDYLNNKVIIRAITAEKYIEYDAKNGKIIDEYDNQYGIIPIIWLRLENSQSFYTSGKFELVENQLKLNRIDFMGDLDMMFNACPIKIATNIPIEEIDMSPNAIIGVPAVGQFDHPPDVRSIQSESHYLNFEDYKLSKLEEMKKKEGIPASMINSTGNPPSGISRLLELAPLIEIRKEDEFVLTQVENEALIKILTITNVDQNTNYNVNNLEFSIKFPPESVIKEPAEEYDHDINLLNKKMFDPVEFVKKYGNVPENATFDDVLEIINERKEQFKLLFGGSPELEEPDGVTEEINSQIQDIKKNIGGDNGDVDMERNESDDRSD